MHLRSHMLISAPSMFDGDSHFALPAGCRALAPNSTWALFLDLLHLDDHEFSRQVVARLSRAQDCPSGALSPAQVKDLALDNMIITLGAKQTIEWLSTIARKLLRPLPLKALTVLTHAFLPQLTYEGETAIASQPFVSKASLDGMEVTATAIACGQEFLHEFWFQFPSSRAPVAFWIPGYDKTYTAAQWYEQYWSSIQLNLDEGTVLAFICQCSSDCPVIPSQSCAGENSNRPGPSSHRKLGGSTEATGPLSLSTADAIACDVGHFVFCGLVGSKDRPKKTQGCTPDWHRTQLKGLQVMLLPGVNLSIKHLLPAGWEVMPGIPSAMLTPSDTVLQVSAIVKVGKTLGGSQLLNIANLPAVHYPFVLGISRQLPCAPFTVEHQDAITDSLFLLLKLFVTQDCSMMAFSSFCKQMLQEAMQDSGHLISTVYQ